MKDHIRDYATAAFRLYAAQGKPSAEALRQQIYDAALHRSQQREQLGVIGQLGKPTEQAVLAAQKVLDDRAGELNDLIAVENTLFLLSREKAGADILQAVEIVYFTDACMDLERGDISARVHRAEIMIPASERQIYYWLKRVRGVFAMERGLRV